MLPRLAMNRFAPRPAPGPGNNAFRAVPGAALRAAFSLAATLACLTALAAAAAGTTPRPQPSATDSLPAPGEPEVSAAEAALLERVRALADPAAAAAALEKQIKPQSSPALWFALGVFRYRAGDSARAARAFRRALAAKPDFYRARLNLARILVRRNALPQAIQQLRLLLDQNGPAAGDVWALLAYALAAAGHSVAAESAYRQALVYRPGDPALRLGLIRCLLLEHQYPEARTLLRRQIAQNPGRRQAWSTLAGIDFAVKDMHQALIDLETIRRLGLAGPQQLATLGDLYLDQGLPDEGLRAYQQAAALENPPVTRLLQAAAAFLDLGKPEAARKLLDRLAHTARLESAQTTRLLFLRGRIAAARGDRAAAKRDWEQVLEQDPLFAGALFALADLEYRQGNLDRADMLYQRAARLPGKKVRALLGRTRIAVEREHYEQAVQFLEQAVHLDPQPALQQYLGQVRRILAETP